MGQEQANVEAEVLTPKDEEITPSEETLPEGGTPTAEAEQFDAKTEIAELRASLRVSDDNYKALQRNAAKREKQFAKQSDIKSMADNVESLMVNLGELTSEERNASQRQRAELSQSELAQQQAEEGRDFVEELLKENELSHERKDVDELLEKYDNPFDAFRYIQKQVTARHKSERDQDKATKEATKAQQTREKNDADGVNAVETNDGGRSGGDRIPTDKDEFRAWVSNLPEDKYIKLKPKIDEMLRGGQIK